jgi:hypothetical protein
MQETHTTTSGVRTSEVEIPIHKTSSGIGSAGTGIQKSGSSSHIKIVEIQGPVYPVERHHEFPKDVPPHEGPHGKDELKYPVLGVDGAHHFSEKPAVHVELQKELHGPMYDVEHSHK